MRTDTQDACCSLSDSQHFKVISDSIHFVLDPPAGEGEHEREDLGGEGNIQYTGAILYTEAKQTTELRANVLFV